MSAQHTFLDVGAPLPGRSLRRRRPNLVVRWRTFWKAAELDQALAAGCDPLASDPLLWRAEQLVDPKARLDLAKALEQIVEEVEHRGPQMLPGPHLERRSVVHANRSLLLVLAERLRSDGTHGLRGLAKADLLVSYGDSALYRGPSALTLKLKLLEALAALDPNDSPTCTAERHGARGRPRRGRGE